MQSKASLPRGYVFYDGPSEIDGSPILGIAILTSKNEKTGDMVQTFIVRADMPPMEAIRTQADDAVCGDCPHRGTSCYVDVAKSVSAVYFAWLRGIYPTISPKALAKLLRRRRVRIGAYGDPAAIPAQAWVDLISECDGHTGYSHQWRQPFAQGLRGIVMASADSETDRDLARAMGWRTFRVRTEDQPIGAREFMCPASDEAGKRKQCIDCLACDGAARGPSQASVVIIVHGAKARQFATA